MNKTLVIYHANCFDGLASAWVCKQKFGDTADYLSMNYGVEPPKLSQYETVYLVDFSFKKEVMERLLYHNDCKIVVIDHHATAECLRDIINLNFEMYFSLEHSGCILTWKYFYKEKVQPLFLKYIQDRDLWKFKLPYSKEINAWIRTFDINSINSIELIKEDVLYTDEIDFQCRPVILGKTILDYQQILIEAMTKQVYFLYIYDQFVPCVNSSILFSEIADHLLSLPENQSYPFACIYFRRPDLKWQFSLRSRSNFDCSVVAKYYGGGGHKQAAGFELSDNQFNELLITSKVLSK